MNQQQINDSFNMKFQHLIDGQQKILDILLYTNIAEPPKKTLL
jgi:hypothetical protein